MSDECQKSCNTCGECFCDEETTCLNSGVCEGCPDYDRCYGEAEVES